MFAAPPLDDDVPFGGTFDALLFAATLVAAVLFAAVPFA